MPIRRGHQLFLREKIPGRIFHFEETIGEEKHKITLSHCCLRGRVARICKESHGRTVTAVGHERACEYACMAEMKRRSDLHSNSAAPRAQHRLRDKTRWRTLSFRPP